MLVEIKKVWQHEDEQTFRETLEFPQIAVDNSQVTAVEPVEVVVTIVPKGHYCSLSGVARTTLTYLCARCLDEFASVVAAKFDVTFTDSEALSDEEVSCLSDDELVLDPYVEEALQLAVEYCPVCQPECKGLCPECGCNRNINECGCHHRLIDPRLEILSDLLSENDSE